MVSLKRALPDFGVVRIDDLADGDDLGVVLPILVVDFVFRLSLGIQRRTRNGASGSSAKRGRLALSIIQGS